MEIFIYSLQLEIQNSDEKGIIHNYRQCDRLDTIPKTLVASEKLGMKINASTYHSSIDNNISDDDIVMGMGRLE